MAQVAADLESTVNQLVTEFFELLGEGQATLLYHICSKQHVGSPGESPRH